jgi:hypothetical protein
MDYHKQIKSLLLNIKAYLQVFKDQSRKLLRLVNLINQIKD